MTVMASLWLDVGLLSLCVCVAALAGAEEPPLTDPESTTTEWRDDVANVEAVRKINRAYGRNPFSREFEGVSDDCPIDVQWEVGPNTPISR